MSIIGRVSDGDILNIATMDLLDLDMIARWRRGKHWREHVRKLLAAERDVPVEWVHVVRVRGRRGLAVIVRRPPTQLCLPGVG